VADCMLITIAPSCLFKTRLPLVNVVVKICITYVGITKSSSLNNCGNEIVST
jgi:hypothetical protein